MKTFREFLTEQTPRIITAETFKYYTENDPSWCKRLTQPLAVQNKLVLEKSNITHLSPHLTFEDDVHFKDCNYLHVMTGTFRGYLMVQGLGLKAIGDIVATRAEFDWCPNIEIAEGHYKNWVSFSGSGIRKIGNLKFSGSGIRKIGNLKIEGLGDPTIVADFADTRITVATGTYPGFVNFGMSDVKEIKNLNITKPNADGIAASFEDCSNLEVATGTYPGSVNFSFSAVNEIRDLHITAPDKYGMAAEFTNCNIKKISNFTYNGEIEADPKTLELIAKYEAEKVAGKAEGPLNDLFG
jgi:hypothetical protein